MKIELEDRLISSIKNTEDLSDIVLNGISAEDFNIRREVFEFIVSYSSKYNNTPSAKILENTFQDFKVTAGIKEDEKKYLLDELKKASIRNKAIKVISNGSDILLQDVYGGIDFLVAKLSGIRKIEKYSKSYTDKDALKRLEELKERKIKISRGINIGLRTGLSIFDDKLVGWNYGNLVAIVGRPGIGKSWLLLYLGASAYLDKKRIAFLSPEMTVSEIELRWDTVMSALYGKEISNEQLVLGKMDIKKYKEWLEEASKRSDWLSMDSYMGKQFDMSTIQAVIDEFSPDLVCVDGLMLLKDYSSKSESWEKMKELAYGLKNLAQNNKVVIITTAQAGREAAGNMPELHQIYSGDALAQSADLILMMTDDEKEPNIRYLSIPKRRNFKVQLKKIKIGFEIDKGKIGV